MAMKLIVQADDYGFTGGVTDGILKCARDGVLTETGLFSNMPTAEYAVRRMQEECPHILLGEDINMVAGRPVTDPALIPSLVRPDGTFIPSAMHRAMDKTHPNHIPYEEAFLETENQVKRFIQLAGHTPGYLAGHSYGTEVTWQVQRDVAAKYDIPFIHDIIPKVVTIPDADTECWAKPILRDDGTYDYSVMTQLEKDPIQYFLDGKLEYLEKVLAVDGVAEIHTHAGYVDRDLIRMSSFTTVRLMEADFLCSDILKNWIRDNGVELVNLRDLM